MRFLVAFLVFFGLSFAHDDKNYYGDATLSARYKILGDGTITLSILDSSERNPFDPESIEFIVISKIINQYATQIKLNKLSRGVFRGKFDTNEVQLELSLHLHSKVGTFNGNKHIEFKKSTLEGQFDLSLPPKPDLKHDQVVMFGIAIPAAIWTLLLIMTMVIFMINKPVQNLEKVEDEFF